MDIARAQQAIAAAAVTLVLWIACVASYLPPLVHHTTQSVLLMIATGMGIAICYVLHLVFVGIAAKRLGRSPLTWVIVSAVFMPIASIVGLIIFEWFSEQEKQAAV